MIRLIIDSTCDMPKELIDRYHVEVLPLFVTVGEESYRDRVDITLEEIYAIMRKGIAPKTSQISSGDTEALFRKICEAGDDLIYLTFSSGMSGTFQLARMLMADIREDYPERRLEAVDSEGGSLGSGLVAMQAARWIAQGRSFDEVTDLMRQMIPKMRHLFTLDSLSWLAKGGRITTATGYFGDKLHIKPLLRVENKTLHVMRVIRGRKATLKLLVKMMTEETGGRADQLIGIAHADDPEAAQTIEKMVKDAIPDARTVILPIGCVLGAHLGIGGVGLLYAAAPVEGYDLLDEDI